MSDRYEFIDAEYASTAAEGKLAPTIMCMCKWLGVSKSGFYEWRSRPLSALRRDRRSPLDGSAKGAGYNPLIT